MISTKLIFLAYMSVSVVGQEDDLTYNYYMQTKSKLNRKHISLSTKQILPYKIGEEFIGYVHAECEEMRTVDKHWVMNKEIICSADRITTKQGVYE